jgi:hypothetical protein
MKALQHSGKVGNVLASEITAIYPDICEKAHVVEIPTRDLLHELGKIAKKRRLTMRFESGATKTRSAYFIPKQKSAAVLDMRRRKVF